MTDSTLPHDEPAASPPPNTPATSLIALDLDNSFTDTVRVRSDGWTSFARRTFLRNLAERASVTAACRTAHMSAQSAYALRNRDPVFASAWEGALVFAHQRLADDLLDRSISGCVEQIHKDGAVVGERHRYDNRLSMAVLARLDRRQDRAELLDQPHLRAAANWEAFVEAVAEERGDEAQAIIAPPPSPDHQLHQLRGDFSPFPEDFNLDEDDDGEDTRIWVCDHSWRTDFPPPADFSGDEFGDYGDEDYSRQCTLEERAVLDRRYPDECALPGDGELTRAEDEAQRAALLAELAEQFDAEGPTTFAEESAALDQAKEREVAPPPPG